MKNPLHQFYENMSKDNVSYFRQCVIECVLATDLTKNMSWLSAISGMLNVEKLQYRDTTIINAESVDSNTNFHNQKLSKSVRMQLALKCADIGHPARSLALHLKWSNLVTEEFFIQGDLERAQGMRISPLCDRELQTQNLLPQGQIGFINFVCKPLFDVLAAVCDDVDQPWSVSLCRNLAYWETNLAHDSDGKG